jgi:hypothetical protein
MDLGRLSALATELRRCAWWDEARDLGRVVRSSSERTSDLLVLGTPSDEPWHLVAHLADASRVTSGLSAVPTLIRWRVPRAAPAHLSIGIERLADVRRSTLLVVAPEVAPAGLLEMVSDARHRGATILTLAADGSLADLAHEAVALPPADLGQFDLAGHVVGAAAANLSFVPRQRSRIWRPRRVASGRIPPDGQEGGGGD